MAFLPEDEAFARHVETGAGISVTRVTLDIPTALLDRIKKFEEEDAAREGRKADWPTAVVARIVGSVECDAAAVSAGALVDGWARFRAAPFGTDGLADRRYTRVAALVAGYLRRQGWWASAKRIEYEARQALEAARKDRRKEKT